MPPAVTEFEGYSYRTSARYGGRVRVCIGDGTVSVSGTRIARGVYRTWIGAQALLMALVGPLLALAAARRSWRGAVSAVASLAGQWVIGGVGAACLWELQTLIDCTSGKAGETATFPLERVRDVRIGKGWSRNGLWFVLLPYVAALDRAAAGVTVSFQAPDANGRDVVYALHMASPAAARALAGALATR